MKNQANKFLDVLSNFLAQRKGLLPIMGMAFIVINWLLQIFSVPGWPVETNLFLHLGVILSILGILLAWAL